MVSPLHVLLLMSQVPRPHIYIYVSIHKRETGARLHAIELQDIESCSLTLNRVVVGSSTGLLTLLTLGGRGEVLSLAYKQVLEGESIVRASLFSADQTDVRLELCVRDRERPHCLWRT